MPFVDASIKHPYFWLELRCDDMLAHHCHSCFDTVSRLLHLHPYTDPKAPSQATTDGLRHE